MTHGTQQLSTMAASDRFADGFCVLFGTWTALTHLAVLAGVGLDLLLLWALATAIAGGCVLLIRRRRGRRASRPLATEAARDSPRQAHPLFALVPPVLIALAALIPDPAPWLLWAAAVAYFAAAAALCGGFGHPAGVPKPASSRQALVWSLALLAVLITWTVSRPNKDDAFYLGIAVAAADFPDRPLLRDDPVHGVAGVPVHHPAYRLHALEIAVGAAARLTGMAAIYWSHFAVSGLGALLLVFAWARLIRLLVPGRWVSTLLVLLLIFLTVGDVHRWYGNYAFVRIFQGKAVFASALLPLIIVYALEYVLAPRARRWLALAFCQAAAVGLTPVAVWIAPAVAGLALLAAGGLNRRGLRSVFLGALASFYPLVAGAVVAVALQGEPPRPARTVSKASLERVIDRLPPVAGDDSAWALVREASERVLGDGLLVWCVVLASALAWWLAPERLARRVCLVFPLGLLICCLNPIAAELTASAVGEKLYWRALWVLPVPLLIAICLTAPLSAGDHRGRFPSHGRRAAALMLSAAFVFLVPERQLLSMANGVAIRPFGLKVPDCYRVAEAVARSAPPGSAVLAPLEVSPWVVTFHRHTNPLMVRKIYLPVLRRHLDRSDVAGRRHLTEMVTGRGARRLRPEVLLAATTKYRLAGICLRRGSYRRREPGPALSRRGFERFYHDEEYEIWHRTELERESPSPDEGR